MTLIILQVLIYSLAIFCIVNLVGGISANLGYTSMHAQYYQEREPVFNFIFKIVSPIFSAIFIAIIFYHFNIERLYEILFISVIGAWGIRLLHNYLWYKRRLINWRLLIPQAIISVLVAKFIYMKASHDPSIVIPNRENMVSQIWLIATLVLYKSINGLRFGVENSIKRKSEYVRASFQNFHYKYDKEIKSNSLNDRIEMLAYAILIHENFNRPAIVRKLERFKGLFIPKGTYGVMQVGASSPISDSESIKVGMKKLNELYVKVEKITLERNKDKPSNYTLISIIKRVAWHYNNSDDYAEDVTRLYHEIEARFFSKPKASDPDKAFDALSYNPDYQYY